MARRCAEGTAMHTTTSTACRRTLTGCPAAPECHSMSPGTGGPAPRRSLQREGDGVRSSSPSTQQCPDSGCVLAHSRGGPGAHLHGCAPARTPGVAQHGPTLGQSHGAQGLLDRGPVGLAPHLGGPLLLSQCLPSSWSAFSLPQPTSRLWGRHPPSPTRPGRRPSPTHPRSPGAGLVDCDALPGPQAR